jgi:hypothetical protein
MPDASSPFLNLPIRSEAEVRDAWKVTDKDRRYTEMLCRKATAKLEEHSPSHCRDVLDGAYTRKYHEDGSYELVPVKPDLMDLGRKIAEAEYAAIARRVR